MYYFHPLNRIWKKIDRHLTKKDRPTGIELRKNWNPWQGWGGYYRKRIAEVFKFNIPADQNVLEIGCGNGDLLATLNPKYGFGIDISPKMIALAKKHHADLNFVCMDAVDLNLNKKFDAVVVSDTVNDVWDVQTLLENVHRHMQSNSRLVINFYNRTWEFPLDIAAKLGCGQAHSPAELADH